jgi:hypothetical protein
VTFRGSVANRNVLVRTPMVTVRSVGHSEHHFCNVACDVRSHALSQHA